MQAHPNFKWLLFVDADIGVINPRHRIEEFINERTDAEIELIFFERLITYEIMAGSYLAKNTLFVHDFLMEWANYTSNELFNQKKTYHQDDEGALHQVLIDRCVSSASNRNICDQVYNSTIDYYAYLDQYVVCARHILGISTRTFGNIIKLIRQGDGWARDGHETATSFWADRDFMFHYWKDQWPDLWKFPFLDKNSTLEFKPEKCHVNEAMTRENVLKTNWKYRMELKKTDEEIEQILATIRQRSHSAYLIALSTLKAEIKKMTTNSTDFTEFV